MAKQPAKASAAPAAYRICFAADGAAGDASAAAKQGAVFRRYADPHPQVAYLQTVPLDEVLSNDGQKASREDELLVVHIPDGVEPAQAESLHRWLGDDPQPLVAENEELGLHWRPGHALIEADLELRDDALSALTDFAFYEGQLAKLEQEVATRWPELEADMPLVNKIDGGNKKLWPALYGRLEHRMALLTQKRPRVVRKLLSRLSSAARVRTRFVHLHSHLEVRYAVYDQIGYRLSDHRGVRSALIIEILIVVLLVAEVGLSFFNLVSGGE